jgi:hypothetical protein
MSPDRRDSFDVLFAVYVAALVAPPAGKYAGFVGYLGVFVGVLFVVYAGTSEARSLHERVARRPASTAVVVAPLLHGAVYVSGAVIAEPPVRSPYVYLGLWNVLVGVAVVAVARKTT